MKRLALHCKWHLLRKKFLLFCAVGCIKPIEGTLPVKVTLEVPARMSSELVRMHTDHHNNRAPPPLNHPQT